MRRILRNGGQHDGEECNYTMCYTDDKNVKNKCLGWCKNPKQPLEDILKEWDNEIKNFNMEKTMKAKQQQHNEYLNNGGTMSIEEWEKDGRYDPSLNNINILEQFAVKMNIDAKRWEFQSVDSNSVSYFVAFHEADNEEDAYRAVWEAIRKSEKKFKIEGLSIVGPNTRISFTEYDKPENQKIRNKQMELICLFLNDPKLFD